MTAMTTTEPAESEAPRTRSAIDDVRGVSRLVIEAIRGITDIVRSMNVTIGSGPAVLGKPLEAPAEVIAGATFGGVGGVVRLVGSAIDGVLARVAPLFGKRVPRPQHEALLAVLNGVLGDHLVDSGNPLTIEMTLRHGGQPLELEPGALRARFPQAGGRLLVLVHGSCMSDLQWNRGGHDHGMALASALDCTPVYLFYNSGLHISTNGRAFAAMLERLVAAWPKPVDELVIVGHSMGGLIARSACHIAEQEKHAWRARLRKLVCLGSPHLGAPLERGGSFIDLVLGVSRYSVPLARLGKIRSAGVTDLRYGYILDEDWRGVDRFAPGGDSRRHRLALPVGVASYAIAGSLAAGPGVNVAGDGLVPVDSALGRSPEPAAALGFPDSHQSIAWGTGHFELLARSAVFETMRGWLEDRSPQLSSAQDVVTARPS